MLVGANRICFETHFGSNYFCLCESFCIKCLTNIKVFQWAFVSKNYPRKKMFGNRLEIVSARNITTLKFKENAVFPFVSPSGRFLSQQTIEKRPCIFVNSSGVMKAICIKNRTFVCVVHFDESFWVKNVTDLKRDALMLVSIV